MSEMVKTNGQWTSKQREEAIKFLMDKYCAFIFKQSSNDIALMIAKDVFTISELYQNK